MLLSLSYTFHLLATVIWLGGLFVLAWLSFTALRLETLSDNQWLLLQRRLLPWIQASLVTLLVTGFYQMTVDPNYGGFLVIDGVWGWAMLIKHIAYVILVGGTLYWQFGLLPEIERQQLIREKKGLGAGTAESEREMRLLYLNCAMALVILVTTAVMTAV